MKYRPDIFEKTYKIFPSVPDYIVMKLTGNTVCDYGNGASTSMNERGITPIGRMRY